MLMFQVILGLQILFKLYKACIIKKQEITWIYTGSPFLTGTSET